MNSTTPPNAKVARNARYAIGSLGSLAPNATRPMIKMGMARSKLANQPAKS